jgi:hypothetical protein
MLSLLIVVLVLLSIVNECYCFAPSTSIRKITKLNLIPNDFLSSSLLLSNEEVVKAVDTATGEVSRFSQVDKTGVIGFFAGFIEQGIDLVHTLLNGAGLQYTYGIAIIVLTCLSK